MKKIKRADKVHEPMDRAYAIVTVIALGILALAVAMAAVALVLVYQAIKYGVAK